MLFIIYLFISFIIYHLFVDLFSSNPLDLLCTHILNIYTFPESRNIDMSKLTRIIFLLIFGLIVVIKTKWLGT